MGLLDDAIREHLDLKRRRGADPAEIERAEREALGPVRRNREPGAVEESGHMAGAELDPVVGSALDEPDGGVASDLVDEPDTREERYDVEQPEFAEPVGYPGEDENPFEDDEPFAEDDHPVGAEPFAEQEDPHRTQVMRTVDVPIPEDATREHDIESAFADEHEADGPPAAHGDRQQPHPGSEDQDEDVLEETPEFLQDTPDHDRLWFEQRPPRDFDFDG